MPIIRGSSSALKSYAINFVIATAAQKNNVEILVRNRRTRDYGKFTTDGNGELVFNAGNLTNDGTLNGTHTAFQLGDVIEVVGTGGGYIHGTHTISDGNGGTIALILDADITATNTPARAF